MNLLNVVLLPQQKDPVTGTSSDWLKMSVDPEVLYLLHVDNSLSNLIAVGFI